MALRKLKIFISVLFMGIFIIKMGISIAPAFLSMDNNAVGAIINQLELENKGDSKDAKEKGDFKDKLPELDQELAFVYVYAPVLTATNFYYHQQQLLYQQTHHPVVLTPPPNKA